MNTDSTPSNDRHNDVDAAQTRQHDGLADEQPSAHKNPYPRWPLFVVFMTQFAEPITAMVVYPFAPALVRSIGVTHGDEKATGYYAGIIESVFFLTECLTCYAWARLSDSIGRRPVLMLGPLGLSIAMFAFGLSSNFWLLVLSRGFQGIFNGNLGIGKTVIAELVDAEHIGDAMSVLPFVWTSGGSLANVIGGTLSEPAKKWPDTLGRSALLRDKPYFLPCAVAGAIAFVSFLLSFVGLRETLPTAKTTKPRAISEGSNLLDVETATGYGAVASSEASSVTLTQKNTPTPSFRQLFTPRFQLVLSGYAHLAFLEMAFAALLPLMYSTSIHNGGLGFSPRIIGIALACRGLASAVFQLTLSARLMRAYGPRRTLMVSFTFMFVTVACFPIMNALAKANGDEVWWGVWAVLTIQILSSTSQSLSYSSIHVLLVDSAPSKNALASINSIAQTMACAIRTLSPSIASSLFSLTLEKKLLGGYLVYVLWILTIMSAVRTSSNIPRLLQREERAGTTS